MNDDEKRFSETEKHCYHTSLVFDNQTQEELGTPKVVVLLNMFEDDVQVKDKKIEEQQTIIEAKDSLLSIISEENEQLRQQLSNYELAKRNLIKRLGDMKKEDFERFFK